MTIAVSAITSNINVETLVLWPSHNQGNDALISFVVVELGTSACRLLHDNPFPFQWLLWYWGYSTMNEITPQFCSIFSCIWRFQILIPKHTGNSDTYFHHNLRYCRRSDPKLEEE